MGIHFTVVPAARLVLYCADGSATANEARNFLTAVAAHPDHRPGFRFLGDGRHVSSEPDTPHVYSTAGAIIDRAAALGPCRWAVVVGSVMGFGMARMMGILTDRSGVEIVPFRSAGEAAAWLGLPADDPALVAMGDATESRESAARSFSPSLPIAVIAC